MASTSALYKLDLPSVAMAHAGCSLPALTMALASVSLDHRSVNTDSDAASSSSSSRGSSGKRKAPSGAHYGISNDSSELIATIVLSRLTRTRESSILGASAMSPVGIALLASLRAVVQRVAIASGLADAAFSEANATSLFNQSGSTVAKKKLYDGGLSLPSRLPWTAAKTVVVALLESLADLRTTTLAASIGNQLISLPAAPLNAAAVADVAALATQVEQEMRERLGASSSSVLPAPQPPLPAPPLPMPQPTPPEAPRQQVPPFVLDPRSSLQANIEQLLATRLSRGLSSAEITVVGEQLEEALSLLQSDGRESHRALLEKPLLTALAVPGTALLWAAALETVTLETVSEGGAESVRMLMTSVVEAAASVAAAVFSTAALGILGS